MDIHIKQQDRFSSSAEPGQVISRLGTPYYLLSERILGSIPLWEPIPRKGESYPVRREKQTSREVVIDGNSRKVAIKVYAAGNLGLPNTLDLEFFRAFEQLATERLHATGTLTNPVRLTGHQLLRAAKKAPNGRAQAEVRRFFRKMAGTTIGATRQVTSTKSKEMLFHIFEAVVQEGDRRADGTTATTHEITLAAWYLSSLQSGNCLVVDHTLFQKLTKAIAKLLHQLLHSLFYLGHGLARQHYSELVQSWHLSRFTALSRIKQQLDPAHHELQQAGFLKEWHYLPVRTGEDYEIRWEAGPEWWAAHRALDDVFGVAQTPSSSDPFLPDLRETQLPFTDDHRPTAQAILEDIFALVGQRDRKYEPFWRQAGRDLPAPVLYRLMGEVREKALTGAVKNKGSYLVTLVKIEAKKRKLPWASRD